MHKPRLLLIGLLLSASTSAGFCLKVKADSLGPADFPGDVMQGMPESYHDAWCKQLKKKCRVKFSGRSMTVDNYSGITREQLIATRHTWDGNEKYFYVSYKDSRNQERVALFLFVNWKAANEFGKALARWYEQDPRPYPNYRYPNSQGPQDTQGR